MWAKMHSAKRWEGNFEYASRIDIRLHQGIVYLITKYYLFHSGTDTGLPSGKAPCRPFSPCGHCAIPDPYAIQHSAACMPLQLAAPTVYIGT